MGTKKITIIKEGNTVNVTNVTQNAVILTANDIKALKGLYNDFSVMNLEFFKWLSTQRLSGRQCRILFYLISKMQFENRVTITHREIYEEMKIHKGNLYDDLRKLIDKKVIMRQKVASATYELRLNLGNMYINQALAYKGKANDTKKVKEHKALAIDNLPYNLQRNLFGDFDILDKKTNKVLARGNKQISKEYPISNEPKDNVVVPEVINEKEIITQQRTEITDLTIENRKLKEQINQPSDQPKISNIEQMTALFMNGLSPEFKKMLEEKGEEFIKTNPEFAIRNNFKIKEND